MRHKLCLDVVSEAPPERAASTHVRRGNSQNLIRKKKILMSPPKKTYSIQRKNLFLSKIRWDFSFPAYNKSINLEYTKGD